MNNTTIRINTTKLLSVIGAALPEGVIAPDAYEYIIEADMDANHFSVKFTDTEVIKDAKFTFERVLQMFIHYHRLAESMYTGRPMPEIKDIFFKYLKPNVAYTVYDAIYIMANEVAVNMTVLTATINPFGRSAYV